MLDGLGRCGLCNRSLVAINFINGELLAQSLQLNDLGSLLGKEVVAYSFETVDFLQ